MSILLGNCISDINNNYVSCVDKRKIIKNISSVINECGINTLKINTISKETIWMRDLFFIVDNQCFLCNLTTSDTMKINRENQTNEIINILDKNYIINYIPDDIDIEGGDIIQHKDDIFIGIGGRTSYNSINFLKNMIPNKNIIPIHHTSLHLDCIFTVLNNNQILYHSDYLKSFKVTGYEKLDIKDLVDSSNPIPCNFLIINDNIVCSDLIKNEKLLDLLKILNYRVYTINMGNLWKEGGGIRCLTQWYIPLRSQNIY